MISTAPFNAKDRLRRTKSSRSIRRTRQPSVLQPESFDSETVRHHATAAATHAMLRSSERSSVDLKSSYDRLGGPSSVAVPQRHRPSSLRYTDDSSSIDNGSSIAYASYSRQSDADSVENQDHYQAVSAALPPISEFQGLDGMNSELPSSYRRLRKAKSMFSTRQRHSYTSYAVSPDNHAAAYGGQSDTSRSYGTLRRSMSFLRGGSQPSRVVRHAKSQDAAIQLARSQFLRNSDDQGIQQRHSSLFATRPRREHKPFRKTFRTVSEPGLDAAGIPSWLEQSKSNGGFHGKARSLSLSIKSGLKRLLGLSKPPKEGQTQAPGLSSPRSSWDNRASTGSVTDTDYHLDSRKSYSLDNSAGCGQPPTIRSIQSSESICTSNSRVTSWTDSTAANTIATRKAGDRLSIIQENENLNWQLPQLTPNNSPNRPSPMNVRSNALRPHGSVDSQRLYSALMKRIRRDNMEQPDEQIVLGAVKEHHPIPERANSVYSHRSKRTIRRVPSEESINSPRSYATANGNTPTVRRQPSRMSKMYREDGSASTPRQGGSYRRRQSQGQSQVLPGKRSRYSLAQENNNPDHSSPGGETARQAYDRGKDLDDDAESVVLGNSKEEPDSPSVYSRTTGGHTPTSKSHDADLDSLKSEEEPGTATIFESRRTPYSSPRKAARSSSSISIATTQPSADWQQWVNSQMARIEELTPIRDHYREDTQIHDSEEDSIFSAVSINSTTPKNSQDLSKDLRRQPSVSSKISGRSNFSRPFNRSPSVRTIVSPLKIPASATVLSSSISTTSPTRNTAVSTGGQSLSVPGNLEDSPSLSPMRMRSNNTLQFPESPTPKRGAAATQQRKWAHEQYRRYSYRRPPVGQDAKAVQYRSIRGSRDNKRVTNENIRNEEGGDGTTEEYKKPQNIHSTISSKRMVEMFLSSRRRQMGSEASDSTTDTAFI